MALPLPSEQQPRRLEEERLGMAPDATLEELRLLMSDYDRHGLAVGQEAIDRMVELMTALDEWITKGGFLPADWRAA